MSACIIASSDPAWDSLLARFPQADIYFTAGWHNAATRVLANARAEMFVFESGGDILVHPFLRRAIPDSGPIGGPNCGLCDLESAYGYSGPLSTSRSPDFLSDAWRSFQDWTRDAGVIAEFIRFHPLAENHDLLATSGTVTFDRETVVVDLTGGTENIRQRSSSQQRRNARKAMLSGIVVARESADDGLPAFRSIYAENMARVGAEPFYRFGETYFRELVGMGEERVAVFVARREGMPVAAALMLLSGPTLHYHLGGARTQDLPLRPMNALFDGMFEWAARHGFRQAHIGGGRTAAPDDQLLRFKAGLGEGRARFHIGRRIFDRERYRALIDAWCGRAGLNRPPPYLLAYRLPIPSAETGSCAQT